jgi:PAS domain S-box-containing protein
VYEAVGDGEDFVFRDYNRAAERMDGVSRQDVIGRNLTKVFPEAEETGLLGLLQSVLRTGEPQSLPITRYQNERIEAWRENYAYQLPSGELVNIYDDITERKRLEADLLHAQKMEAVGRLAGGVAHDFNNLLQVVTGSCDLLLSGQHDAAEQERMLREVRLQSERGAQLVRRLLVFSRRERRVDAAIDLGAVLRGAESLVRRLLKENIRLKIDLADTPLPVAGDQGQLEQVLMNLVVNAADAMPEGGGMEILSGAEGASEVWFSVADSGQGIPTETLDRVFDPYFTTKSAAQGTGLGLAVVHGIVSQHQGRIEIDNRPGEGVTFKVVLPRSEQQTEVVQAQPPARAALQGNGERVLIVEDQDPVRKVMKSMLTRLRYQVTTAADGASARRCAKAERFDLLVSDIVLPDTTGVDLARELRRQMPTLGLLLVSGYAEESVRQSASDVRFLQKPFRLADLEQQVTSALRERPAPG